MNKAYLDEGLRAVWKLPRGTDWLDAGTPDSLLAALDFVKVVQVRQGLQIGCPEEVAWRSGFDTDTDTDTDTELARAGRALAATAFGQYLLQLCKAGDADRL